MWIYRLGLTKGEGAGAERAGRCQGQEVVDVRAREPGGAVRRPRGYGRACAGLGVGLGSRRRRSPRMKLTVNHAYEQQGHQRGADARPDPRRPDAQHARRRLEWHPEKAERDGGMPAALAERDREGSIVRRLLAGPGGDRKPNPGET